MFLLWGVPARSNVQSRSHHLTHQWSQINTSVLWNHMTHHQKLNPTSMHAIFLESWVRSELGEEEKNKKKKEKEEPRGLEGQLDNWWGNEETGQKENNKPPNPFIKLLKIMRYEPKPFSTCSCDFETKIKKKPPSKWPKILTPAAKKN